jgi:hypothetical protein
MRRGERFSHTAALRESWGWWTEVVDLFARRRAARKRVDPLTYIARHRELIARCRVLAATANEVDRAFYCYLEDLAQPWLDPTILARADREILFDLLLRCQSVEQQLGGRSWLRWMQSRRALLPAGALIFAIMLLWMGRFWVLLSTIMDTVRSWANDLSFRVTHASDPERLFVIACILIVVSIYMVSRTARS